MPMADKSPEDFCLLRETKNSVTSISTVDYVPQPVDEKSHFVRNRIFVGNFPKTATQKDISKFFSQFGEIIQVNVIEKSKSSRYAFVTFRTIATADVVIDSFQREGGFSIQGCPVNINRALFKPRKQAGNNNFLNCLAQRSVVRLGDGKPVAVELVNGTAYFQPLPEPSRKCDSTGSLLMIPYGKGSEMLKLPPFPPFYSILPLANMQIPFRPVYSLHNPRYPLLLPQKGLPSLPRMHFAPSPIYPNLLPLPPQLPMLQFAASPLPFIR